MHDQPTHTTDQPQIVDGVLIVDGYGLRIAVQRRHLLIVDGSGRERRERSVARVGHGLRRLVVMGHSGTISLEAVRWLDRVGIQLLHIDSDGRLLTTSARQGVNDARLRRAQALAGDSPVALDITKRLLDAKLAGQTTVTVEHLHDEATAARIERLRQQLDHSTSLTDAREIEASAAHAYFAAWPGRVLLRWAARDRVPDHWTRYSGRRSPLSSGAAIRAADPVNAILNYLYALAESECRLACLTMGLDPGLGFLHADRQARDSLALDLIEVVRPAIEGFTIDLADGHIFRIADFIEREDGHCRILPPLTHHLAKTLPLWETSIGPWAEMVAHMLAESSPYPIPKPTPLTGRTRRQQAIDSSVGRRKPTTATRRARTGSKPQPTPQELYPACIECGQPLRTRQRAFCPRCWPAHRGEYARRGSDAARAALTANGRRRARGDAVAKGKVDARNRRAAHLGHDPDVWERELAPRVSRLTLREISSATGLSTPQASRIKRGAQAPRPDHWTPLRDAIERSERTHGPTSSGDPR